MRLSVVIVNESDIRRIADGKLLPAVWGFFNNRHAERYRMLVDFARNFQNQLVRSTVEGRLMDEKCALTSEQVHADRASAGYNIKRVQSQPNLAGSHGNNLSKRKAGFLAGKGSSGGLATMAQESRTSSSSKSNLYSIHTEVEPDGGAEENCLLRLHVPHFVLQQPTDLRNSFSCKDFKEIREFNSGQASEQGTL